MEKARICLVLWFVCLAMSSSQAQNCYPFSPSPLSSICTPVLPTNLIFLPPKIPQTIIEQAFSSYLTLIKAIQPISPLGCYSQLLSLLCNTAFPSCSSPNTSYVDPACKSTCENVNEECSALWSSLSQDPLNCSLLSPFTGHPLWPEEETLQNGELIPSSCFHIDQLPVPKTSLPVPTCPFPLTNVDNPTNSEVPCAVPCPDPTLSLNQWHTLGLTIFICTILSFSLMLFLSIHYMVSPDCRHTFGRFQLYSYLYIMIWEFSMLSGGPDPIHDVWCESSTKYANIHDAACGAQGLMFTFFGLGAVIWVAVSAMVMYKHMIQARYTISKRSEIIYTSIGVGVPLLLTAVPAKLHLIQFYWRAPVCFVQGDIGTFSYHYIFFYIPVGIAATTAIGYTFASVIKISIHVRTIKKIFNESPGRKSLQDVNLRLVIWCTAMSLIFFTTLAYRFILGNKGPIVDWIKCRIMFEMGLGPSTECYGDSVPNSVSFAGTMTHWIIVPSMGTFSFLVSGTKPDIYVFWFSLFRSLQQRDWAQCWEILTLDEAEKKRKKSVTPNPSVHSTPFPSFRTHRPPLYRSIELATIQSFATQEEIPQKQEENLENSTDTMIKSKETSENEQRPRDV